MVRFDSISQSSTPPTMKVLVVVVIIQAICASVVSSFSFSGTSDCPAQGVPGVTLKVPDPNDCSAYSLCLPLFGLKLNCPEGEHFSAAAGKCLSAANAGCDPERRRQFPPLR
ncbi:hypothetical protein HPB49_018443 [Dermacentor silvarum]|uniref:Uncharacterized protein n=1 Tax=Dermacentor silvarum TaxID=543639 RepID=A0ACB8D796_DERSI|nr:hypothetical protein HPB49_018443 [Dermacentor silvarum]